MVNKNLLMQSIMRVLPAENLELLFNYLTEEGKVHGPVEKEPGLNVFRRVYDFSEMNLAYTRTKLPPKKYLSPPEEPLFCFDKQKGYREVPVDNEKIILFGIHPCDIHGINLLDKMANWQFENRHYNKRRENLVIVGLSCMPDERCFCLSSGYHVIDEGFDIFLAEIGDDYFVRIGSGYGEDVIKECEHLFRELEEADLQKYLDRLEHKRNQFELDFDALRLPQALLVSYGESFWEEAGEKCLSCGACAAVCPTCYCYSIFDDTNLDGSSGQRKKQWADCMQNNFSEIAGNVNFRTERSDRLKTRILHKLNFFNKEFNQLGCVGCGRCTEVCPVDMSIINLFENIAGRRVQAHE